MTISRLHATNSNTTHSRGIPPRQGGAFLGEREGGERVDGRDALQWVPDSACAYQRQRDGHGNLRAGTGPERLFAEPSAFPASAWGHYPAVSEHGTTGRMCERWWNEAIVLGLSKQHTDRQGWEAAELARRVAARRWLQHRAGVEVLEARPPTRVAGREELQVVAQIASSTYDGCTACEWNGRRGDPTILHDRGKILLGFTSGFLTGRSLAKKRLGLQIVLLVW